MVKRILDATASDFLKMNARDLQASIRLAEGRTIAAEAICTYQSPIEGVTHGEIARAMGADMIVLDRYDPLNPIIQGVPSHILQYDTLLLAYKKLLGVPIGINMIVADENMAESIGGRLITPAHVDTAAKQGVDLINIYVRPQMGGTHQMMIDAIQTMSQQHGQNVLLIAVPSFSRPAPRTNTDVNLFIHDVKQLISAGCHAIALPMPSTKQGWLWKSAQSIIDAIHAEGCLAWLFLTGSVEGASPNTIETLALQAKESGADAYRIDEAGLSGMAIPNNIYTFSVAIRGERHTLRRMASSSLR